MGQDEKSYRMEGGGGLREAGLGVNSGFTKKLSYTDWS